MNEWSDERRMLEVFRLRLDAIAECQTKTKEYIDNNLKTLHSRVVAAFDSLAKNQEIMIQQMVSLQNDIKFANERIDNLVRRLAETRAETKTNTSALIRKKRDE